MYIARGIHYLSLIIFEIKEKHGRSDFVIFYFSFIIPGKCCWDRLKGFTIHGEPNYVEIYVDRRPTVEYLKDPIIISLPESYRNTKFSNITIAIPAKDNYSVLALCEVEVYLGKWITYRVMWTDYIT